MSAFARVSGLVLNVDRRSGIARTSGNAYELTIVRVLVADTGTTEVLLSREAPIPTRGELVDYLVEFSLRPNASGSGASLSISAVSPYPSDLALSAV